MGADEEEAAKPASGSESARSHAHGHAKDDDEVMIVGFVFVFFVTVLSIQKYCGFEGSKPRFKCEGIRCVQESFLCFFGLTLKGVFVSFLPVVCATFPLFFLYPVMFPTHGSCPCSFYTDFTPLSHLSGEGLSQESVFQHRSCVQTITQTYVITFCAS